MSIAKAQKFYDKQKYKQAEQLCLDALEAHPGDMECLRLQSLIMLHTNRVAEGVEFLNLALAKNPDDSQNNVAAGLYSVSLNNYQDAENYFLRAHAADKTNTDTLLYLAENYTRQEDWAGASVSYAMYIAIDPNNHVVNQLYANLVSRCVFEDYSDLHINAIKNALQDSQINPRKLFTHWLKIIFNVDEFKKFGQFIIEKQYDWNNVTAYLNNPFFTKGVERLRINAPIIEVFLTNIRHKLLSDYFSEPDFDLTRYKSFLHALSMQCWLNEYIFYDTKDEKEMLVALSKEIEKQLLNSDNLEQIIPKINLLSCYQSPVTIGGISSKINQLKKYQDDAFLRFLKIQLEDTIEEDKIKKTIPVVTEINDKISISVQNHYEENPYPRSIDPVVINQSIIDNTRQNILFAGCGTGLQILGYAQQYPNACYTALDLSSSSLAYASRHIKENLNLSPKRIRYGKADILKLNKNIGTFDRIFCTGVIHHMQEPEEGLKKLKSVLSPDGEMRLALYSEMARDQIVEARRYISANNYDDSVESIKQFRHDMITMFEKGTHPKFVDFLVIPLDFYTVSECRDFIFHQMEHRYTIPQILEMLDRNSLEFIKFEIRNQDIKKTFKQKFPDPNDYNDPMKWHEYEQEYPHTFVEMYVFDVRHKGTA